MPVSSTYHNGGDSYTHTETTSYGENVGDSFGNIVIGFILLGIGICLLVWNEGNSFKHQSALREGIRRVITIMSSVVNPEMEGQLVHVQGCRITTPSTVMDSVFGVRRAQTLKLRRQVEMYQWREYSETSEETRTGGEKVKTTTYRYEQEWSTTLIPSNGFERTEYQNPTTMRFPQYTDTASPMEMGAFTLSPEVVELVSWYDDLSSHSSNSLPSREDIPDALLRQEAQRIPNGFYFGRGNPSIPHLGDHRVTFQIIPEQMASLVAQQTGSTFRAYRAKYEGSILMLERGDHNAVEMFQTAQARVDCLTRGLRVAGLVLLFIGFSLLFQWLATLLSFLPFLQKLVGGITAVVSFLLAVVLGGLTIVLSWIFQRFCIVCCRKRNSMEDLYQQNVHANRNKQVQHQHRGGSTNMHDEYQRLVAPPSIAVATANPITPATNPEWTGKVESSTPSSGYQTFEEPPLVEAHAVSHIV